MVNNNKQNSNTDTIELLEYGWRIYLNTQEMIKFADQKVNVLLVISGVMSSFVFNNIKNINEGDNWGYVLLFLFIISLIIFLIFGLLSIFSRKATKTGQRVPKLIYFGHIAQREEAIEYYESFKRVSSDDLFRDLCYQIYEVGVIAALKHSHYKGAWFSIGAQAVFFVLYMWKI